MKYLIVVLALFGAALAVEEDVVRYFANCVGKALDGGLPEAHLPDHNPFSWTRNLTFDLNDYGIDGYVKADNVFIEDIVYFDVPELEGKYLDDDQSVYSLLYQLYWERMRLHGDYIVQYRDVLSIPHTLQGYFNLSLNDLTFTGLWEQTTGVPRHLNDFTLEVGSTSTDLQITGLGLLDTVVPVIQEAIQVYVNSDPDLIRLRAIPLLQRRFNALWLEPNHSYRIDDILDNCRTDHDPITRGHEEAIRKYVNMN